ncbi:MAG: UbiA prenyltransferase family protein [Actinobacteria bacterium]|nr:UbiA prenyltransferase family protein [Actinomycetota bacterium]
MRKILLLLDFARARSAVLSLGEPATGALIAYGAIPHLRVISLGLLAAMAGYLCVYALNDLLDLRSDRREIEFSWSNPHYWDANIRQMDVMTLRHPIAAGALPLWAGVTWVAGMGLVGLTAAYLLRPICAWLFALCALQQVIYCLLRRRTWLKVIPAGTMVSVGGLAGWFAVGRATWGAFAFFFLLLFWEIFGRNLSNDLADVDHDRMIGIATLAATHSPDVAINTILTGALLMPVVAALQPSPWPARVLLVMVALATMTIPALLLSRHRGGGSAQHYFNRASLFPPGAAGCLVFYYLVRYLA